MFGLFYYSTAFQCTRLTDGIGKKPNGLVADLGEPGAVWASWRFVFFFLIKLLSERGQTAAEAVTKQAAGVRAGGERSCLCTWLASPEHL